MKMRSRVACSIAIVLTLSRAGTVSGQALPVHEPSRIPRTAVRENGETPRYYTVDPPGAWFATRLSLGPAIRVYGDEANTAAFAFDAIVGARIAVVRAERLPFSLLPDLGYGNVALGADSSSHLFMAGLGFGVTHRASALGVVPRFVIGEEAGKSARGVRTALLADGVVFNEPGVVVELSHTMLWLGGSEGHRASHDVRFIVGLDLTLIFTRRDCHVRLYGSWDSGCKR